MADIGRTVWKGTINFGIVTIPAKAHKATREHKTSMHLVSSCCEDAVSYDRVCKKCGKKQVWAELKRGYRVSKDKLVIVSKDELEQTTISKNIEVQGFVSAIKLDTLYLSGTHYYLTPNVDLGAEKAFGTFFKAMNLYGLIALVKWGSRGKEHLGVIRPYRNGGVLQLLHWADEIVNAPELPAIEVSTAELEMIAELLQKVSTPELEYEKYTDTGYEKLNELILAKLGGKTLEITPEVKREPTIDLKKQLEISVAQITKKKKKVPVAQTTKKKKA